MVTCFICFIRSRKEEDEELVEQVQYGAQQQQQQQQHQQQYQDQARNHQQQQQHSTPKQRQKLSQSPSENMMINQNQSQMLAEYQARNTYAVAAAAAASPYHSPSTVLAPPTPRTDTRSDITQQINSAIIGSSEAEFQNDFIQVSYSFALTSFSFSIEHSTCTNSFFFTL